MDKKDLARFLSKVDQYELVDMCWNWLGTRSWGEYGSFKFEGKHWQAHKWSYTYFWGPIAKGLVIDHLCRNKLCVNPYDLEAVTHAENIIRGELYERAKTHCERGHEFTDKNTYIHKTPYGRYGRQCRECEKLRQRRHKALYGY